MKTSENKSGLVDFQGSDILFYIVVSIVGVIVAVALVRRKRG